MHENLSNLITYKTLHALCSVNKQGKMQALFYTTCLIYGRAPLWAVWRVSDGRLMHWATSKDEIEHMHPGLAWRKVMARWRLFDDANADVAKRRLTLSVEFNKPLPGETILRAAS